MLWTGLVLTMACGASAEDFEARATRLAELRQHNDALAAELTTAREQHRELLKAQTLRSIALEAEADELHRGQEEVQLRVATLKETLGKGTAEDAVLRPALLETFDALATSIERGLPYRIPERLAALEEISGAFRAGKMPAPRALSRLWDMVEDEVQLTKENALDRQVLRIDGKEVFVDVARLGMVALYFKTPTGQTGHMARDAQGTYRAVIHTEASAQAQTKTLFEAFKTRVKTGRFELPNAFPHTVKGAQG